MSSGEDLASATATSNEQFHFPSSTTKSFLSDDSANALEEGTGTFSERSKRTWDKMTYGGTTFDGFLLAASQEVGQSILTLPNVFSQTGFIGGVILELVFATLALYTNYLLVSMHAQHRHNLKENGDAKHHDPYHIVSYHEVSSLTNIRIRSNSLYLLFASSLNIFAYFILCLLTIHTDYGIISRIMVEIRISNCCLLSTNGFDNSSDYSNKLEYVYP